MDFWFVVQIILRTLSIIIAFLLVFIYIAIQCFQKIPSPGIKLQMFDYIALGISALLFALGFNSYFGFLAFIPPLAWKFFAQKYFAKPNVSGTGRWMEVKWHKFPPKGFANVPQETWQQLSNELQRLPKDTHFIIPRFVAVFVIKYMIKRLNKEKNAAAMQNMGNRQNEVMQKLEDTFASVLTLEKEKNKVINLPFGVLHIGRL